MKKSDVRILADNGIQPSIFRHYWEEKTVADALRKKDSEINNLISDLVGFRDAWQESLEEISELKNKYDTMNRVYNQGIEHRAELTRKIREEEEKIASLEKMGECVKWANSHKNKPASWCPDCTNAQIILAINRTENKTRAETLSEVFEEIEIFVKDTVGERCKREEVRCQTCQAWRWFDEMKNRLRGDQFGRKI